jgi:hypothetical protein
MWRYFGVNLLTYCKLDHFKLGSNLFSSSETVKLTYRKVKFTLKNRRIVVDLINYSTSKFTHFLFTRPVQ